MNERTELNNALILDALAAGRLRANPDTGSVWLDDELQTHRLRGYVKVTMDDHFFGAHRVIWLDAHGHIPPGYQINHRNSVRSDNRLTNLEAVTPSQNRNHAEDAWWPQPFIRAEDLEAVSDTRPDWLDRVLALAADPNVTVDQVNELRAEARSERTEHFWACPSGSLIRRLPR